MSAICGVIQFDKAPDAAQRCERIQTGLQPYGRHAEGLWSEGHLALGSRLTRLLPEDSYDRQPLQGTGGRFVMVADVRLDNRDELGQKLHISPADLQTMADATLLLAAYERWERRLVEHLVGDFAFAVWDRQQQSLFMARDHMGRRPLFYHQGKGWFAFATMPAGLLALPEIPAAPDEERLRDLLLVLPDHSSHSYFSGIHRLLPAHTATLDADGTLHTHRYWEPPTDERIYFQSDDDYVEGFLEQLERAVRCRLRSVGGVASHLSAGFDSSTVTSIAAHQLKDSGQTLDAFTSVPHGGGLPRDSGALCDEGPLAAQVAALFPNIRHHRVDTVHKSMVDMLEQMFRLYNRPAKNVINMVWDTHIAELAASRGATTLLTGELGNFTISYSGEHHLNSLMREGKWRYLSTQLMAQMKDKGFSKKLAILYRMLMPSLPDSLQSVLEQGVDQIKRRVRLDTGVNSQILQERQFQQYCRQLGRRPNNTRVWDESREWRKKLLHRHDFAEYAKGTLALAGIDRRDPTVDIRLIAYCQAIPVDQFHHNTHNRWLLRRALRRYWPEEVISTRAKGFQGADWFFKMQQEQTSLSQVFAEFTSEPLAGRLLDIPELKKHLSQFEAGESSHLFEQNFKLLRVIALGYFLQRASHFNPSLLP